MSDRLADAIARTRARAATAPQLDDRDADAFARRYIRRHWWRVTPRHGEPVDVFVVPPLPHAVVVGTLYPNAQATPL